MKIENALSAINAALSSLDGAELIECINEMRAAIHEFSPFKTEPVDFVRWAPSYRRLCKVLLRNDWWCKGLGLTQPKSEAYGRYLKMKKERAAQEDMEMAA